MHLKPSGRLPVHVAEGVGTCSFRANAGFRATDQENVRRQLWSFRCAARLFHLVSSPGHLGVGERQATWQPTLLSCYFVNRLLEAAMSMRPGAVLGGPIPERRQPESALPIRAG